MGVIFDRKLNFEANVQAIKKKLGDRFNLLKILSYDKTWKLTDGLLIKMYKSLIRSVIDYASITTGSVSLKIKNDLEVLQNNALRIIFKKGLLDKISNEELRTRAGLVTVKERHHKLMLDYYEKAIVTENPLIKKVFDNFKKFKTRNYLKESLAVDESGRIRNETLDLIKKHNVLCDKKKEMYPTTLDNANVIIIQMILDNFSLNRFESSVT